MQIENSVLDKTHQGKVRDTFRSKGAPHRRLIVATDRISAFDVIMREELFGKGQILTTMTVQWINYLEDCGLIAPIDGHLGTRGCYHHFISEDVGELSPELTGAGEGALSKEAREYLDGRSMVVRCAEHVLPIECIVRGYLEGSGWKSYQKDQTVCGYKLPAGLIRCSKLPHPLFTPSTKAEPPYHDENVSRARMTEIVAEFLRANKIKLDAEIVAGRMETLSLAIYAAASKHAEANGIIIADTKFEFGLMKRNSAWNVMLIDEVLTPDSSRYWDKAKYAPGRAQDSMDKQPLRDHLEAMCARNEWNKEPPPPALDPEVLRTMLDRYREIRKRLFGA